MFISPVSRSARKVLRKLPLRLVLTLPFVVQTVGVVTLVGYLSYRSGQQAVADLARQLMQEKGDRIVHNLEHYFKDPKTLLREHQAAIKLGILNWQNTSLMQTYFTQQLKIHTDVGGLMISTQRKDFLAVGRPHPNQFVIRQRNLETGALENYTADLQGNRLYLRDNLPNYDPHADPPTNPWYTAAKKSKEGFWQLVVSLVRGKDHPILMMAYFLPFADSQGKFQGVLSSSVYLDRAGTFLRRLQIGKTGQAFIMDEKGLLIATSTTESPFRWERSIKPKETLPPEVLRLAAQDSQNPVTRTAAAWSVNQRDSLNNDSYLRGFRLHNQQYFGRVIPFQLDDHIRWTIVVVVPESDFMAQIQANIYRTMLLCGLALLGSIGSGIWTSKRITRSLFRLTQATQTVAAGTLDVPLPSTRILEVENLTASFRQMVRTLQEANQLRQNYAQDLERQVAEKTALLNEALQVAKIGSWSWNLVSDERWWSPQMYQILGLNPDEYSTPPDVEITNQNIHPEDRERVNQITRDAIKQGISYNIEFRFLHSDGSIIYVFSRGLVEHDSEGTITRFWGITQDISDAYRQATQRQATEIALQESELKFATIFQDSPQPAWIATLAEGRCLEVNESFCRFLGHSHAEAIGKTCVEVQLWNDLADLHHFRKTLLQTGSIQDFEVVFRTRAGEAKTVLLAARVSRLNDQDCVIGVLSDISSRKLAEIALKQSETRFLEISESSPANIYIIVRRVDGSFYFEHMSRAIETIHELSVEQVLENANILLDRIHPEDRASYEAAVNVSIETLQPFQHEWRVINPSGKIKWLQGSSRPKRRDNGEIAWYGIVIDISDRKQAEIALQQNEARFQQLAAATPGIIYSVVEYPSGAVRFEYVSPAFEEIHEASVAQVYQDATIPFHQMHPDDRASYQQAVAQALDTMQTFRHEWRIITPSGKLKWIQANSRPERRDNGEVVWHGVVQDISDYKAAEIALQAKTEELDRFFSTALDLLCIANTNGYFLRLNPQWEKTLGYRLEDLEGVKFLDFVHPEDLESTLNAIALLAKQQEVPNFMNRYRCRDGSYRWIEWRSVPVGQLIYAAARDVSDRKYAEEALKNSERKFKGAFNTPAVGMCLVSIAGGFLEVNSALCQLLGYSESELLSIRWQDIVYPEDQSQELEWVEQMYAGKQVGYQLEQRFLRQDGTVLWGLSSISLMRGPQQEPLYLIAQVTDINERKQSEIALQSAKEIAETANRSKSVFLANMSHELRTPLNGILGYAQILQRDKNFTPKQKEGLGIIQQCGEHLLTLINDILDLSKIEADKLELHPGDFNFPAFLQGIFEIFRFKAVRKSIHFTYLTTQQLPTTVRADEKRLRQILMNLLSNAIKFTDTGTVIFKVEVISDKSLNLGNSEQKKYPIPNSQFPIFKIRFQVDDTGIGITPEHLEKIFLPFEQVGDSSRYTEGTGLGLAITQKLIGLMGSQIFVESIPNVGSKFWFDLDLPVITNSIELTPIKPACNIIGYQGKKRKILVVDDRWENCAVLINLLEPLGFELFEAANGKEGLEKAIEVQPDLIFVDLVMPMMDGHEMTRKLRQLPLFQSTIIIAISANAFETDRLLSLKSGCNNFFPKPLQTEALLDKIKSYLNLTWIYDGDNTGNGKGLSTSIVDSTLSQMVIPPPEELLALSQAAQIGDVSEVEQEINRLQQLNPEYTSFVTKIVKLAEEFEYEKIVNLVDGYFKPDSAP